MAEAWSAHGETLRQGFLDLLDRFTERRQRHRAVLIARLGLDGEPPRTLGAIATEYQVSRERIRQLETAALISVARAARYAHRGAEAFRAIECLAPVQAAGRDAALEAVHATEAAFPAAYPRSAVRALLAMVVMPSSQRRALVDKAVGAAVDREHNLVKAYRSLGAADRASRQLQRLLAHVEWPSAEVPAQPFVATQPQRKSVRRTPGEGIVVASKHGAMPSAKLGRDVSYDSLLELSLLLRLDAARDVTRFVEQPFAVYYEDWDGGARKYYPDLLVELCDGRILLLEVKPLPFMPVAGNLLKYAAARRLAHDRGWGFLVTDGHCSLAQLMSHEPPPRSVAALAALARRRAGCGWAEVRLVRDRYGLTSRDLSAAILQNEWRLNLSPYRLSAPAS